MGRVNSGWLLLLTPVAAFSPERLLDDGHFLAGLGSASGVRTRTTLIPDLPASESGIVVGETLYAVRLYSYSKDTMCFWVAMAVRRIYLEASSAPAPEDHSLAPAPQSVTTAEQTRSEPAVAGLLDRGLASVLRFGNVLGIGPDGKKANPHPPEAKGRPLPRRLTTYSHPTYMRVGLLEGIYYSPDSPSHDWFHGVEAQRVSIM
jgi:hypothetical protein